MNYRVHEFIDAQSIKAKVCQMGKRISEDYAGKQVMLVGLLKGSVVFLSDLARAIEQVDVRIDFMTVESYGDGLESSREVKIIKDLQSSIDGKHVILVEDIVDTAHTLSRVQEMLLTRNPASLKIATLLNKPSRRERAVSLDYVGFDVPNKFVVGYGIDYAQKHRELPFIGVVEFNEGE